MEADGRLAAQWLEELGAITDEPPGLTRTFLSPALNRAKLQVAKWMREAGLDIFEDGAGNLIGRRDCGNPTAGTVACGSHLDTVRNAGKFDGALGVVAGILAVSRLRRQQLPYHIEVVAFSDEEGVRYQTTYLGSRFYASSLSAGELAQKDESGVSVREAIDAHRPAFPAPPRKNLLGYVEVHIEQGPVLENSGLALGVVTGIAGQTRARVFLEGKSGHAGTTPMNMRRDALAAAAECISLVESLAVAATGLVATVGDLRIPAAASNVIPGRVDFTVDVRDADDATRENFCRGLFSHIEAVAEKRGVICRIEIPFVAKSVACDPVLSNALTTGVEKIQPACPGLVSGAGHDAVTLAEITRVAMLFVRCREGLSHHPDEFAAPEDIGKAVEVLTGFLSDFPAP